MTGVSVCMSALGTITHSLCICHLAINYIVRKSDVLVCHVYDYSGSDWICLLGNNISF